MDKLNSIQVFLQVARLGSFSGAAQHLGISKAMASKHVSHLEDELDVRLINRTTRHLKLTEAGILYRDRIQRVLDDMEDTEASVAQASAEPTGTLRIMAPVSFGSFHLTRAIADYRKLYPGVNVDLIFTGKTPDLVGEGLDLAIRTGALKDSSQIARKLSQSRLVVCAAPDYLKEYGTPEVPDDLVNFNCLVFSPRSPLGAWPFTVKGESHTVRVHGNIKANAGEALRIAAIKGCGLIQLPTYMIGRDIGTGRLQPVLESFEPPALEIHAVYLHRQHLTAKVSTFVDFLHDLYQPIPYWEHWTDTEDRHT